MADTIIIYPYNILELGSVTVTGSPDTGYPEARLYDRSISLFWKDTVTEAKNFVVDQSRDALAVDFLAIEKHNFDGEDMQWQWSTDDFASDTNDAVTDWTQSGNGQIIKTLALALTKDYWRVTLSSMANPRCSEIWIGGGYEFNVLARPGASGRDEESVQWDRTAGNTERSTKHGKSRRRRNYTLFLSAADLASFKEAVDYLDEYSLPCYIKDHTGDYYLARLAETPAYAWDHPTYTHIGLSVIEMV